jgi:hypothetical protein
MSDMVVHTETRIFLNFQSGSSVCFCRGRQPFMFAGTCSQLCVMECILITFNTNRDNFILCLLINGNVNIFLREAFKNGIKFDLQRANLVCKYTVLNSL